MSHLATILYLVLCQKLYSNRPAQDRDARRGRGTIPFEVYPDARLLTFLNSIHIASRGETGETEMPSQRMTEETRTEAKERTQIGSRTRTGPKTRAETDTERT